MRELILEPIDVTTDPLCEFRLLQIGADEHVLMIVMEHIISDTASIRILVRDLRLAYERASSGGANSLPAIPVQLSSHGLLQQESEPGWVEEHGLYWTERLAGCGRVRFPTDLSSDEPSQMGWVTAPVHIDARLRSRLVEWCKPRYASLVMTIFTSFAALVLRWCRTKDVVIRYVTDGRVSPKLANTIGFFAFPIHMRVQVSGTETFSTLMDRIREEYCAAYEHADFGYIESRIPRAEFVGNPCFNWIPRDALADQRCMSRAQDDSLIWETGLFETAMLEHPMLASLERDSEPTIMFLDTGEEINGRVYYREDRYSAEIMHTFSKNLLRFVDAIVDAPHTRISDLTLD
jgi:hypothetical protein